MENISSNPPHHCQPPPAPQFRHIFGTSTYVKLLSPPPLTLPHPITNLTILSGLCTPASLDLPAIRGNSGNLKSNMKNLNF